jgi:hypothetical protein
VERRQRGTVLGLGGSRSLDLELPAFSWRFVLPCFLWGCVEYWNVGCCFRSLLQLWSGQNQILIQISCAESTTNFDTPTLKKNHTQLALRRKSLNTGYIQSKQGFKFSNSEHSAPRTCRTAATAAFSGDAKLFFFYSAPATEAAGKKRARPPASRGRSREQYARHRYCPAVGGARLPDPACLPPSALKWQPSHQRPPAAVHASLLRGVWHAGPPT